MKIEEMFPDKVLANAIEKSMKHSGDPISYIPYLKSLYLNCDCASIQSLDGLQAFKSLETFIYYGTPISDISALEYLTNLMTLEMPNLNFSGQELNIKCLAKLTNLQTLNLKNHKISDLSPLSNLVNLKQLVLEDNLIKDISILENFKNLESLDLSENEIVNVSPLENLTKLESLYLRKNNINDFSSLLKLVNISTLDLSKNETIKENSLNETDKISLKFLSNYGNLLSLNLSKDCDLTTLPMLKKLKLLNIIAGDSVLHTSLSNAKKLKCFSEYDDRIKDYSFILNLPNLEFLQLPKQNVEV